MDAYDKLFGDAEVKAIDVPTAAAPMPQVKAADPYDSMFGDAGKQDIPAGQPEGSEGFFGGVADFGRGLGHAAISSGPVMAGQALQRLDPDGGNETVSDFGKSIEDFGEKMDTAIPSLQESVKSEQAREESAWNPRGWGYQAGESLVHSVAPVATVAAGAAAVGASPFVAGAAGLATVGGLFYGSNAEDTYRRSIDAGLSEEDAMEVSRITGAIEGGGEMIANAIPLRLFGVFAKPVKNSVIKSVTAKKGAKQIFKDIANTVFAEEVTEIAQSGGQALAEDRYNVRDVDLAEDIKSVIGPTLIVSMLFGAGGVAGGAYRKNSITKALENVEADPEQKDRAIGTVYQEVKKVDEQLAGKFLQRATYLKENGKPIILAEDSQYMRQLMGRNIGTIRPVTSDIDIETGGAIPTGEELPGSVAQTDIDMTAEPKNLKNIADELTRLEELGAANGVYTAEQAARVEELTAQKDQILGNIDNEDIEFSENWQNIVNQPDDPIQEGADQAALSPNNDIPEPTQAQMEAGRYKKGPIPKEATPLGMRIMIENPAGSVRKGVDQDGNPWEQTMNHHYGYIQGFNGNDGDKLDVFFGPNAAAAETVHVVDQYDQQGEFDEHKVILGANSEEEALDLYESNYNDGWDGAGAITTMTIDQFKEWGSNDGAKNGAIAPLGHKPKEEMYEEETIEGQAAEQGQAAEEWAEAGAEEWNGATGQGGNLQEGQEEIADERRDQTLREKRISEMTHAELTRVILESEVAGIPNRRAYMEETNYGENVKPVQVAIDADSLKWINNKMGHENGDRMLKNIGQALKEELGAAFHFSGDEFVIQGDNRQEIIDGLKRVESRLKKATLVYTTADGKTITKKGIEITYGISEEGNLGQADERLNAEKERREQTGERAARGETPPGISESTATGGQIGAENTQEEIAPPGRTPAQLANDERLRRERTAINTETDDIFKAISKLGGLDYEQVRSEWGQTVADEITDLRKRGVFGKPVIRKTKGKPIDRMLEEIKEYGYLPQDADINDFLTAFSDALGGADVFSIEKQDFGIADEEIYATMEEDYFNNFTDDELVDDGFFDLDDAERDIQESAYNAIMAELDDEDFMERVAMRYEGLSDEEYYRAATEDITAELERRDAEGFGRPAAAAEGEGTQGRDKIGSENGQEEGGQQEVDVKALSEENINIQKRWDAAHERAYKTPTKEVVAAQGKFEDGDIDIEEFEAVLNAAEKPAAPVESTAPEHQAVGVNDRELSEIVDEFNQYQEEMKADDFQAHHLFDPPAKKEIIRLNDKVKVYNAKNGWMTLEEAQAEIRAWEDVAVQQGIDSNQGKNRNRGKVVLSLFDKSGEWSLPWEQAGYDVYRFDIQDGWGDIEMDGEMINPGDINNFSTEFFNDLFASFDGKDIHAILAACPCTDFAVSGARHFAAKDADGRTVASVGLVHQTLATIEHFKPAIWAIENPVGRIGKLGGLPPWKLSFDPFHLGENYTKKTLIWGRFNADLPIAPVEPTEGSKMHKKYGGKSLATKNARSVTPEGFAYSFFRANNAIEHPINAIAWKYDRLDRAVIEEAVNAGMSENAIDQIVQDFYYQTIDDEGAEATLKAGINALNAGLSDNQLVAFVEANWQLMENDLEAFKARLEAEVERLAPKTEEPAAKTKGYDQPIFRNYDVKTGDIKGETPRRISAAKRAIQRQIENDGLFPGDKAKETPEERIARIDKATEASIAQSRRRRAREIRKARALFSKLPENLKKEVADFWNNSNYPKDPGYFIPMVDAWQNGEKPGEVISARFNNAIKKTIVDRGADRAKKIAEVFTPEEVDAIIVYKDAILLRGIINADNHDGILDEMSVWVDDKIDELKDTPEAKEYLAKQEEIRANMLGDTKAPLEEADGQTKFFATPSEFGKKPQNGEAVETLDFELEREEPGLFDAPAEEPQQAAEREPTPDAEDQQAGPVMLDENGRRTDGKPLMPGDIFTTATGRETTPYPKYSTKKTTKADQKKAAQWMIDNYMAEAAARGDGYNQTLAKAMDAGNFSTADGDGINLYLFGAIKRDTKPVVSQKTDEMINNAELQTEEKHFNLKTDNPFSGFKNAREAVEHIVKRGKGPGFPKIAKRILPHVPEDVEYIVVEPDQKVVGGVPKSLYISKGVYLVDRAGNTARKAIFLKSDAFGEGQTGLTEKTILHEALHAALKQRIEDGNLKMNAATPLGKAVSELFALQRHVVQHFNSMPKAEMPELLKENLAYMTAISSVDELVSWGLTDKNMQEILKSVPYEGEQSTWKKFVRTVARILGIEQTNALSALINSTDLILTAAETTDYASKDHMLPSDRELAFYHSSVDWNRADGLMGAAIPPIETEWIPAIDIPPVKPIMFDERILNPEAGIPTRKQLLNYIDKINGELSDKAEEYEDLINRGKEALTVPESLQPEDKKAEAVRVSLYAKRQSIAHKKYTLAAAERRYEELAQEFEKQEEEIANRPKLPKTNNAEENARNIFLDKHDSRVKRPWDRRAIRRFMKSIHPEFGAQQWRVVEHFYRNGELSDTATKVDFFNYTMPDGTNLTRDAFNYLTFLEDNFEQIEKDNAPGRPRRKRIPKPKDAAINPPAQELRIKVEQIPEELQIKTSVVLPAGNRITAEQNAKESVEYMNDLIQRLNNLLDCVRS